MCELRSALFKQLDLETIEEEEADNLSLNSRNNLRNGINRRSGTQSRPLSQANTITTYDTQNDLLVEVNSLAYQNINGNRLNNNGSLRFATFRSVRSVGFGTADKGSTLSTNKSRKSADKWDSNYFYNDYDPTDPLDIYLSCNPPKGPPNRGNEKKRLNETDSSKMANCFNWLWFGSSVRYLILLLSFLSLASLFANIQLFNLVALYAQDDLLPSYLQRQSVSSKPSSAPLIGNDFGEIVKANGTFLNEDQDETKALLYVLKKSEAVPEEKNGEAMDKIWERNETKTAMASTNLEKGKHPTKYDHNNVLFDRLTQSFSFSVPGVGILLGHFPSVLLIRHISAHKTIFVALILSGAVTAAFPFIIGFGPLCVFLSRALLGLSFAPAFAFVGVLTANWAALDEQLLFILSAFLALQFGPITSWAASISLLSVDNHNSQMRVFGLHSAVSTLLAILWLIFYRDNPQKYALVNEEEVARITRGKSIRRSARPRLPRPLPSLLIRSASAWVCWLSSFCYSFVVLSLHIFLPVFTFKMLRLFVGFPIVFPFVILLCSHLFIYIIGPLFGGNSSCKVRTFNSIAFLGAAMAFITVTIIPRDHLYENRCSLLLRVCLLPLGLCSAGFIKSAAVCGRLFTQHIVAHMQLAFGLAYFLVPTMLFMTGAGSSTVNWRLLFLCCALLLVTGFVLFLIFGRGVPSGWANKWAEEAKERDALMMVKFTRTPFE